MKVTKEICSFDELLEQSWSGAKDTLKTIEKNEKEDKLMQLLDDIFGDGVDKTELNDFLWFETETIYDILNIKE